MWNETNCSRRYIVRRSRSSGRLALTTLIRYWSFSYGSLRSRNRMRRYPGNGHGLCHLKRGAFRWHRQCRCSGSGSRRPLNRYTFRRCWSPQSARSLSHRFYRVYKNLNWSGGSLSH